ncbi:hypothetical protein ATANTOWER_022547 [Ataeniobius toweri]|uniref:Uncharacterized protein n=1 Tax=Ataeniobius toweri TaxID=208326 RepID=A0ABU7A800_9TELE|nr:hypothetical protein [Ataeniobius toweri]
MRLTNLSTLEFHVDQLYYKLDLSWAVTSSSMLHPNCTSTVLRPFTLRKNRLQAEMIIVVLQKNRAKDLS